MCDDPAIVDSLRKLTAGWSPASGVAPEALTEARRVLALSLIAGKSLSDIHSSQLVSDDTLTPVDPRLDSDLADIAASAAAVQGSRMIAVVRSPLAATAANPAGRPGWTRGALVTRSFGPFEDLHGVTHWVDLILLTASLQFIYAGAGNPFAVFPVQGGIAPPPSPADLILGAGSVWFLANLLANTLPAGQFTGFAISGGTLHSTAPLTLQNGRYVIPAGAALTLTIAPQGPGFVLGGSAGLDAKAAKFSPPASVTVTFRESDATFDTVDDARAEAYGSSIQLHWNKKLPAPAPEIPATLVPCDFTPARFSFANVQSKLFTPSGEAAITAGGWALPLAASSIDTLPEASGAGAGLVELDAGSSVRTALAPAILPVSLGLLEIGPSSLLEIVGGQAKAFRSTYQLWPEAAPAKLHSSVVFDTAGPFALAYLSSPAEELLFSGGFLTAHLDRPLAATGARFPFTSAGFVLIAHTSAATILIMLGIRPDSSTPVFPLALENALLGVDAPVLFVLEGVLQGHNVRKGAVALVFRLRWLLPTLPDPYAANFDLSAIPGQDAGTVGTLLGITRFSNGKPSLAFQLLPPPQGPVAAGTPFAVQREGGPANGPALLDLSTKVDLFGVALFAGGSRLLAGANAGNTAIPGSGPAPALALTGMQLALNGALTATFALPQVSWEPMESTATPASPIYCQPASDGPPLLLSAPDSQQLVPFIPGPVLLNNIANVAAGRSFAARFSLPFGLTAVILQGNEPIRGRVHSTFLREGGQFRGNIPVFPESFVPNPAPPPPKVTGAVQLTVMPPHPELTDASFSGFTEVDAAHGPFNGAPPNGYGYTVLGVPVGPADPSGVGIIFENDFGSGAATRRVPLRRIDFSGYGASLFSEWNSPNAIPPAIIKVQFETTIGRTAYEVVKAASVIYPHGVRAVRTVTMERQNAGWLERTDSGWQPVTPGVFQYPPDPTTDWTNRIHLGALQGAFNVRNIREQPELRTVPNPVDATKPFKFQKVLFDADLGFDASLNLVKGGFHAPVDGVASPPVLVFSKDLAGYLQLEPDHQTPGPEELRNLLAQTGPLTPAASCVVEVGSFGGTAGTVLRCSAFEINMATQTDSGAPVPALAVALRGAPQIPRGGGWSMGTRKFTEAAPKALPNDFPVPLVRPTGVTDFWHIADTTDVLQLTQPDNFYSLLHETGTNKVLFESPRIPTSGAPAPGLQFPKPGPPKGGGAPQNPGSPNLGDMASILNSTGLFPDIANALSLLSGAIEQIDTVAQGFHYSKTHTFDPSQTATLIDNGVIRIALQYADTTLPGPPPAQLVYSVDSSTSPSWSLSIGKLSFLVSVPLLFGNSPILTITGGFKADEHTKAGLTDLNVQMGDALGAVKDVFSKLQTLAQFLPGGGGANLDIALSNGKLTVSDTFTIGDLPLGLGDLTDVSLDLGLTVQLSPLSVDFVVGIGSPGNPFNWIVSPLAGNGLMDFGVRANKPSLTIQAGIGLGLAIDLGIASGSASITIAVQLNITGSTVTLMAILSGQASVDVLDGLASASLTLTAALGFSLDPIPIPKIVLLPPPPSVTIPSTAITMIAACSVGIHISICWVVSVSWDGSWQFSQTVHTPELTVSL